MPPVDAPSPPAPVPATPAPTPPSGELARPAAFRGPRARSRPLTLIGLLLFIAAFAGAAAIWGLPWSRDRLAIWLVVGLAAVSLGDLRFWARGLVIDWAPLLGLLFAYDLARGYADGLVSGVYIEPQLRFDEVVFGGTAPTVSLQRAFWDPTQVPSWYDYAAWAIYTSHFFVALTVAAVLWRVAYPRFRRFAASFVALTLLGFATYVLTPAMPPWLAAATGHLEPVQRIVPQMWRYVGVEPAAILFEGGTQYSNDVAALPSLHAAYPVLLLLFFWSSLRALGRTLLGAYAVGMALTLVYSGEHYVADILLGWLYAMLVHVAVTRLFDWHAARSTPLRERAGV